MSPSNWCPISLQNTIYKMYAAVLSRRLAGWAIGYRTLSLCQKRYLPMEGSQEHAFLLESVFTGVKKRCRNVRVLWLDLKNAFGSVSHQLIWWMLQRL